MFELVAGHREDRRVPQGSKAYTGRPARSCRQVLFSRDNTHLACGAGWARHRSQQWEGLLRMDEDLHRPAPVRRDRGQAHVQRNHHRKPARIPTGSPTPCNSTPAANRRRGGPDSGRHSGSGMRSRHGNFGADGG